MTFIPSVLSNIDQNNSTVITASNFTGTSTVTTGYNYLILTINSTNDSVAGGIQIYMNNDGESASVYYTDTYQANTNYCRNFKIVKKNYYITFTANSSSSINISSRLTTAELQDSIHNSVATFDFSKEFLYDAFGKLRISEPVTLIDIKIPGFNTGATPFINNTLALCSDISGTYSITNQNGYLQISGTNIGYAISQSRKYNVYQPGKSLLVLMSGIIVPLDNTSTYVPNFTGRIGYFTNENGVYYEYSNFTCSIGLRNNNIVTNIFSQNNWNLDTMDGNGPSKINLDFTKAQLFVIDIEWLGVGRIRFGFYAYGQIHYCHQITNINALSSGPYMTTANLPIRYELFGSANTGVTASITQICSTVISEGGYTPFGRTFSVLASNISINNSVETPVLAIRGGGSNYKHQNIIPLNTQIVNSANANTCLWKLRLYQDSNTTNVGATGWNNVDTNYSVSQYATSFTGFSTTNSIIVQQGIFSSKSQVNFNDLSNIFSSQTIQITANINDVSDILVITAQSLDGANATVYATIDITEVY